MNAIRNLHNLPPKVEHIQQDNIEGTLYLSELRKASQQKAKAARQAKIYLMRLCVIVNAIITALITFIVATMFVFIGYVAHDGVTVAEFFPIIVTVLVVPVMLWEVERRYLIG